MKLLQVKLDHELVDEAEAILENLGLDRATALTLYYQQIVLNKGLPFDVRLPRKLNQETIAALEEDLSGSKAYSSLV
ncbi:type II toxin-antitoxin system RelB/DinJ family antitoxin [Enterococcus olivae]